ncbi:hypothetical protein CA13_24390 [Planctomycetes bacterium CA13]|uniref:Zinc finger/thioredoxin putative domain-containing protein n=1 Tax=Novipirellula herctigrandis TaxID=2527986 RepID=A0A5C5Z0T7_9BACT|nr:hypothetical protein CA13_24390 [Planctomycetes bacterium CA13]
MPAITCPHCQAKINVQKMPAGGKIKCPRCAKVISLGRSQPSSRPSAALNPNDEGFDFAQINFPSAGPAPTVSQFPVKNDVTVYAGPIPGDPLADATAEEQSVAAANDAVSGDKKRTKKSPLLIGGIAIGVIGLLAVFAVVGMMLSKKGGGSAGESKVDAVAAVTAKLKPGFYVVDMEGVAVAMPNGSESDPQLRVGKSVIVQSSTTGSMYFFKASTGSKAELDVKQLTNRTKRELVGDLLGVSETTRNGYKGIKGTLATSFYFSGMNMPVEVFNVDGRFVIIGCVPASMGADVETQMSIDRGAEAAEQEVFYDSFTIGSNSGGGWF